MDEDKLLEALFLIHEGLPQQGPGDNVASKKALEMVTNLPDEPKILDVGCGTGRQSVFLANETKGEVVCTDIFESFLEDAQKRAKALSLSDRVHTMIMDMNELDFPEENFDLIWSEGAIYIMGFENGLKALKPLIKKGGHLVVTEVSWLRDNPPGPCLEFWAEGYPGIKSVAQNLGIIHECGYELIGHFTLPVSSWEKDYYGPLLKRIPGLKDEYAHMPEVLEMVEATEFEIDLFRKYNDYYGYEFYIMKKGD